MPRTVTLKGNPVELAGPELKVGDKIPNVSVSKDLVTPLKLSETTGKTRIFSVVPSLDTAVCAIQTKRFNEEVAKLPGVTVYTVSTDLPFAQARFCGAEHINPERMITLSDHKDTAFGQAFGTLVPAVRIECRAVFVVDKTDVIRYAEYVPEIANEPNYARILETVRGLS